MPCAQGLLFICECFNFCFIWIHVLQNNLRNERVSKIYKWTIKVIKTNIFCVMNVIKLLYKKRSLIHVSLDLNSKSRSNSCAQILVEQKSVSFRNEVVYNYIGSYSCFCCLWLYCTSSTRYFSRKFMIHKCSILNFFYLNSKSSQWMIFYILIRTTIVGFNVSSLILHLIFLWIYWLNFNHRCNSIFS